MHLNLMLPLELAHLSPGLVMRLLPAPMRARFTP